MSTASSASTIGRYIRYLPITLGYVLMARDEARHGKAFEGLLKRYFGK